MTGALDGYTLTDDRTFAVHWGVVAKLLESNNRAKAQLKYSKIRRKDNADYHWWNPFSWSLPDEYSLDVDWNKVKDATKVGTAMDLALLYSKGAPGGTAMASVAAQLSSLVNSTERAKKEFMVKLGAVSANQMQAVGKAVGRYGATIDDLKTIRDVSGSAVLIGATVVSGGTATALLTAAGAGLRGAAKYQDMTILSSTRHSDASIAWAVGLQVAGDVFFTCVPAKTLGENAAVIIAQASVAPAASLVEGKSVREAWSSGAVTLAGGLLGAGFEGVLRTRTVSEAGSWVAELIDRSPLPAILKPFPDRDIPEYLIKQAASTAGGAMASHALAPATPAAAPPPIPRHGARHCGIAKTALAADKRLLDMAVINMSKGVGRGW